MARSTHIGKHTVNYLDNEHSGSLSSITGDFLIKPPVLFSPSSLQRIGDAAIRKGCMSHEPEDDEATQLTANISFGISTSDGTAYEYTLSAPSGNELTDELANDVLDHTAKLMAQGGEAMRSLGTFAVFMRSLNE